MSSGTANRNICPLFAISVPMEFRSMGLSFETGGDGVKVGDGETTTVD